MLADLTRLLQNVNVLFAKLRVGIRGIVCVDQLRQPQRASHSRRPAADDHYISRHLRSLYTFDRFSEDDHWTSLSRIPRPQTQTECLESLSQRVWYAQLFADPNRCRILNLTMPRNGAGTLGDWIVINAVAGALPDQRASVCFKMTDQVNTLHIKPRKSLSFL